VLVPEWSSRLPSTSNVSEIFHGITNRIFHVTNASNGVELHALVRVFGAEGVISKAERRRENRLFAQLAERGVAPSLLGTFGNGRVEQWLHARTISLPEMVDPRIVRGVAEAMARLHSFCPEDYLDRPRQPVVWTSIERWMQRATQLNLPDRAISVERVAAEVADLRHVLEQKSCPSPVVFCHNDLVAGNIMVSLQNDEKVHLIDFEYSGMSYRGFDIGNFFCEAMGGTEDGLVQSSWYPSVQSQSLFCYTYLTATAALAGKASRPVESEVLSLVAEANQYGLLSHLYWVAWALAQSGSSTIRFPYVLFAKHRFEEYLRVKLDYIGH
jgi:thiamine kinase-like enzyme